MMKSNKDDLILKNSLVMLNKNFKPFEVKLYYGLLSKFTYEYRQNNKFNRDIEIDTIEVKKLILGGNTNLSFKRYCDKLQNMEKWLKLEYDESIESFKSMALITGIEIKKDKTIFTLNYDICEMAKEQTNKFAIINLIELSKLVSSFSIKAYEICSTYKNLKSGFYNMTYEKFRWYFRIPDTYKSCNIDQKVLKPLLNEINEKTRFTLKVSKIKYNNKITHYRFYIKENETNYLDEEIKEEVFLKGVESKISSSNKEPDIKQSDLEPKENISYNEFFEKVWENILNHTKTEGSRIRKGKGSVKTTQRKKLMKIGEEVLNRCLDLYLLENTDKKYHVLGSTWLNSRYEDYLIQAQEIPKEEIKEQSTEDLFKNAGFVGYEKD